MHISDTTMGTAEGNMKKIGNSPGNEEKFFGYVEIGSQKPDYFST